MNGRLPDRKTIKVLSSIRSHKAMSPLGMEEGWRKEGGGEQEERQVVRHVMT